MDVETRARDALNGAVSGAAGWGPHHTRKNTYTIEAVCRLIEQQDAFRRKLSDDMTRLADKKGLHSELAEYILPEPVDPLLGVAGDAFPETTPHYGMQEAATHLREALTKRGLSIVPTVDGEGAK